MVPDNVRAGTILCVHRKSRDVYLVQVGLAGRRSAYAGCTRVVSQIELCIHVEAGLSARATARSVVLHVVLATWLVVGHLPVVVALCAVVRVGVPSKSPDLPLVVTVGCIVDGFNFVAPRSTWMCHHVAWNTSSTSRGRTSSTLSTIVRWCWGVAVCPVVFDFSRASRQSSLGRDCSLEVAG